VNKVLTIIPTLWQSRKATVFGEWKKNLLCNLLHIGSSNSKTETLAGLNLILPIQISVFIFFTPFADFKITVK